MIRKSLQAGWGRKPIALLAGIITSVGLAMAWDEIRFNKINPLDGLAKIAFVAAAFSVTAYNLRVRVIDLIMKLETAGSHVSGLCEIARSCGKRLTNLVILFTFSACCMGIGGLVTVDAHFAKWVAVGNTFLFSFATIHFFYILFAFERLEEFMLVDFSQKLKDKQIKQFLEP